MPDGSVVIEAKLTDEEIEKGINSIKTDLKSLEKASSSVSKNMANHFKSFGDKASKVGTALTVGITTPLTALGVAGVKYNATMEDFEANLTTLLGNADDAKDMLADLKEMANTTPFETTDLLDATQTMLGFGLEAKKTKGYLQTLGDISMGNAEKLKSLTRAFSQIGAAGKATMEDINQMIDAGFNPLQIMSEKTGKSMAELREEVSDGEISFEDIADAMKTATSEGGRYYKSMEKASKTMNGKMSSALDALNTALGDLTESLLPLATTAIEKITEWANAFTELDDESKKTILTIAGIVAAVGPVITIIGKLSTGISATIKLFGSFKSGIDKLRTALSTASSSTGNFSKIISAITSPVGLAITAITLLAVAIGTKLYQAQKKAEEGMQTVVNGIADFINGIDSAEGYLNRFNETTFATTEEQQALEEEMKSIQDGITQISKTASDERRAYTQAEIDQLNDYFEKMRELQEKELEIQQSRGDVLTEIAQTEKEAFNGSYEEFVILSQDWIKTAQEQAEVQKQIAENYRIDSLASLKAMYGEKATMDNAEYARAVQAVEDEYNKRVEIANQQVADVTAIYSQGATERIEQDEQFNTMLGQVTAKIEETEKKHAQNIENIKKWTVEGSALQNNLLEGESMAHETIMKGIWKDMDKNMSDSQKDQLASWIAMNAQTEMYGEDISEENKETVDAILKTWEYMPDDSKEIMSQTMQGMLNGMKEKEPDLYAKASSMADKILGRLRTVFDIGSPSKETKEIFEYVMEGAEVGLDRKEKGLYKDIDRIAEGVLERFRGKDLYNKMQSAVDFETRKLSTNLTSKQVINTQIEDNRQATLQSIDDNKEIIVNSTTKLDSKVIARETNKVNARRRLQYSY